MSKLSNDQGRAFEFACLTALEREIYKSREVRIEINGSYHAVKRAWDNIESGLQSTFETSAHAGVLALFDLEPLILESDSDVLTLKIQSDKRGEEGDIRDVLIIRQGIDWEIGLSVKHNHFAVKHSRLAKSLDFGDKWFGVKCSEQYWKDIAPIFSYLETEKKLGHKWSELPAKEEDVYIPLLNAFVAELRRSYALNGDTIPRKIVEYLLGEYDFYKVISIDGQNTTQLQTFNLRGTLNRKGRSKPNLIVPIAELPTRIVSIEMKPDSNNTVELYLDSGWQFGLRIHNAATYVETSLKFDVQIVGMPTTIICIDRKWEASR